MGTTKDPKKIKYTNLVFQVNMDELMAAVYALQLYHNMVTDDQDTDKKYWTWPMVHMLNFHMFRYRGFRPINVHPEDEQDDWYKTMCRDTTSDEINVNGKTIRVENRPEVIKRMLEFCKEHDKEISMVKPDPPEEEEIEVAPPSAKRPRKRASLCD